LACLVSSNIRDLSLLYASREMLCALVEKSCARAHVRSLEETLLRSTPSPNSVKKDGLEGREKRGEVTNRYLAKNKYA